MFTMEKTTLEEENHENNEGRMEMNEEALLTSNNNEERRGQKIMIRVVYGNHHDRESRKALEKCCCQADECGMDLRMAKNYNQRHKVCERHSKAPVVLVSSIRQRFCQQCSRFHELARFDDTKRSCRESLAGHNKRRRKAHAVESVQQPYGHLQ